MKSFLKNQTGAVVIFVSLALPVIMGMGGIGLFVGIRNMWEHELHNAAEAAAHAGTLQLDGTDEGMARAVQEAIKAAAKHKVAGNEVTLDPGEIQLGYYEGREFTASSDPGKVTAVKVSTSIMLVQEVERVCGVDLPNSETSILPVTVSYQTRFQGKSECVFPLAISACDWEKMKATAGEDGMCDYQLNMISDGSDTVGWADVTNKTASATQAVNDIQSCPSDVTVGDEIGVNNGAMVPAFMAVATAINNEGDIWDTAKWGEQPPRLPRSRVFGGRGLKRSIMIFDSASCTDGTKYIKTGNPIVGFATAIIYDVAPVGANQQMAMKLVCDKVKAGMSSDDAGNYGTRSQPTGIEF